jgi:uncharacterized protein YbgA (DUF1722 family)/uncharacterized protein YbbK (DUF523 family)
LDSAARPRIGISSCLLGQRVRYDGGHKLDSYLVETFGQFVEWVPVCPEVECGLPVPREAMHLEGDPQAPRLVTIRTRIDYTERMLRWAQKRLRELEAQDLCGFVFKANSPSSGMERVRIYDEAGTPRKVGVGLFARAFIEHFPLLPVEDEGRLHDSDLRENFVERVFCLKRYRDLLAANATRGGLVEFHTDHKMLLLSHSTQLYREMGNLVARAKGLDTRTLFARYEELMMRTLRLKATPSKHVNVLHHLMGFLKGDLSSDEKQELLEVISRYKQGLVPLVVPVTLMQHYVLKYGVAYLKRQVYLNPHPLELKLRNHA